MITNKSKVLIKIEIDGLIIPIFKAKGVYYAFNSKSNESVRLVAKDLISAVNHVSRLKGFNCEK